MNIVMLSAFFCYFALLITIGLYFYRKNSTASSYMVGNRSVNYWVTAIATQASDMGSWLFLGFPAMVYQLGVPEYWAAIGLIVGMYLNWQFVAPRLRTQTAQLGSLTLTSFLADKANDRRGIIHVVSSIISLTFFSFYIASGLVGLSLVFESAFGLPYHIGMITSVITVVSYTLIGGFVAVAWCDFFQGIFLAVVLLLVPIVALITLGGTGSVIARATQQAIPLSLITSPWNTLQALLLAAGWGLGYFGQPHILTNFMGIDDPNKIAAAKRVGISWQIIVLTAAASVGLIGIGFFTEPINPQLVFVNMATTLFHPFFAGLVLCAILAATLSTLDSLILLSGSTIAEDLYKQCINPSVSPKKQVVISRVGSLVVTGITLIIALHNNESIYQLVNYAWSGLGSSFGPIVLVSLYAKHLTPATALAGIITGAVVSGLWPFFDSTLLPLVPGFCLSLLAIGIVHSLKSK